MRRIILAVAAAALSAAAGGARAQTPGEDADVRCVAAFSYVLASTTDEKAKTALTAGVFYYIGKFDGRRSNGDLEAAIRAQLPSLLTGLQTELARCGQELQKRGQDAIAIGARLQAKPGG